MKHSVLAFFILFISSVFSQENSPECDTLSNSILFDSGDYSINKMADSVLMSIILDLELSDVKRIELVGHTDKHGSIEYNRQLSKQRVETVEEYLLDYIDIEIKTDYYGESKLLTNDTTQISDQLNRRVEIKYYLNCETDESQREENSIIYSKDPNCHIDSVITNAHYSLNLNGTPGSKVVVIDWTRSMYAYGLQLLNWFENNQSTAGFDEIFIFNDGDGKRTSEKFINNTDGIYSSKINDIDSTISLMVKVADKGTGGDYPENYIEALLRAQNSSNNLDTLVLIADNRACIRDYKLLDSLNLPVIVILN